MSKETTTKTHTVEDRGRIKQAILEYISGHKGTSYVELEGVFDRLGFDWRGGFENYSDQNDAVVFWSGWNLEAFEILGELLAADQIKREPCQFFIYLIDGKALDYPVLKGNYNIKRKHWLPCVFNVC